ncbi:MAG: hypothetical protein GKR89_17015 [Candidatus Latescibacteria bacterium]|nr:hypothetical protein [Candidatus Latescibacterota bacterium]
MHLRLPFVLYLLAICSISCGDGPVRLTLLHINDVYEIAPLGNGQGGLARVATLKKQVQRANENTWLILAGDLFSPSALGLASVDGDKLAGRQMVDIMRRVGLDYAIFGNHEFDLTQAQFYRRLRESQAPSRPDEAPIGWLSSNVFDGSGLPFPGVPAYRVVPVGPVRVGLFGLTLDSNQNEYVQYDNRYAAVARSQVRRLRQREKADIVIAVTHLDRSQDSTLAAAVPGIDLILGGHDHDHMRLSVYRSATDSTVIFKADANARSAYIHNLAYDTGTDQLTIDSHLQILDERIDENAAIAARVAEWIEKAFAGFRLEGLQPRSLVATPTEPLDGLETSVRSRRTRLTQLLADGMRSGLVDTTADLAIFNGGSIRLDDILPTGSPLREYDIIRILPFGGVLLPAVIKGDRLQVLLDAGQRSRGSGGYLQTSTNTSFEAVVPGSYQWSIDGHLLNPEKSYLVALNDYVLTGRQTFKRALAADASAAEKAALFSSYIHLIQNRLVASFDARDNTRILDQKRIPLSLRKALQVAYQRQKIAALALQKGGVVTIRTPGSEWLIKDEVAGRAGDGQMYFARRLGSKLVVYDTFASLGEALNNALGNYVHVHRRQIAASIAAAANTEALDAGRIPDALRRALPITARPKDDPLPADATWKITVGQPGSQWLLTGMTDDSSQTYFAKRYGQQLIVYHTVDMRQVLIEQLRREYP